MAGMVSGFSRRRSKISKVLLHSPIGGRTPPEKRAVGACRNGCYMLPRWWVVSGLTILDLPGSHQLSRTFLICGDWG